MGFCGHLSLTSLEGLQIKTCAYITSLLKVSWVSFPGWDKGNTGVGLLCRGNSPAGEGLLLAPGSCTARASSRLLCSRGREKQACKGTLSQEGKRERQKTQGKRVSSRAMQQLGQSPTMGRKSSPWLPSLWGSWAALTHYDIPRARGREAVTIPNTKTRPKMVMGYKPSPRHLHILLLGTSRVLATSAPAKGCFYCSA